MNIFENLIKDTEIIGISSLNSTEGYTTTGHINYPNVEYSFRVFTKGSSLSVYSPTFRNTTNPGKNNADDWLKKYLSIRNSIAIQIGELQSNS